MTNQENDIVDLQSLETNSEDHINGADHLASDEPAQPVVETPAQAAPLTAPLPPALQAVVALREDGLVLGFVPRVPAGEQQNVPLVAQIVYQDVSLAVQELEAALSVARRIELQVAINNAFQSGQQSAQQPTN